MRGGASTTDGRVEMGKNGINNCVDMVENDSGETGGGYWVVGGLDTCNAPRNSPPAQSPCRTTSLARFGC